MGLVVLIITGYFLWRVNYHLENDQEGMALLKLCMAEVFLLVTYAIFA